MTGRQLTRRSALGLGLGGASLAAFLAACAHQTTSTKGARRKSTLGSESGGVRIWNWPDYIDDKTIDAFSEIGGVASYEPTLEDNTAVATGFAEKKLGAYDIVVPTYWLAARLIAANQVEPLPTNIPNHANIDTAFLRPSWDRGARFHMPWQSAITGIAYNVNTFPKGINTIKELLDASATAPVSLLAEMRDTVALAMLSNGRDPSQATFDDASNALDALRARKGSNIRVASNYTDLLRDDTVHAALAWSGDIAQLQQEPGGERFKFVIAEEGGMQFFDTMVIPNGAPNGPEIARFMNYVYDPVNAARITAAVQYISPVIGVRDELVKLGGDNARLADNPLLFPDDDTRKLLTTWGGMAENDEDSIEAQFTALANAFG
jgi:spermidine/putrescine transport system substrate-binding protein